MITKYSADALRFWAAGSKLGDDLPFQDKDLLTGQKTVTKLWNASKFSMLHIEDFNRNEKVKVTETFDKWLLSKLHKSIKKITTSFNRYEYSKAKAEVEKFFWNVLCDNYLEIVKDRLYKPENRENGAGKRKSSQYALYTTLFDTVKLMAPIMPHITEEVYQLFFKGNKNDLSVHISSWPKFDKKLINEQAEIAGDIGVDIISAIRRYKSEKQLSLKEELSELILCSDEENFEDHIKSINEDLKAVLNVKNITFEGKTDFESDKFLIKIGVKK